MIPSAEPSPPIRSYHVLMAMVFAVALGAGWMMLPGDNELIAMLERDGHARAALGILEQGYASGDRRYRTLHQMLALYEEQGDTRKARTILEEMVHERPYDPALRERLVKFYQAIGDQQARMVALKAQIETRYKEAACRQYVALLRLKGNGDDEIAGLQFCRQRGYRRPDDLARLAELLAASGDSSQASAVLRAIDDVKRLTSRDNRFLFIDLLLQQGQPNEAVRRSVRWIKATKDQALAVAVVDILARSNYPDSALDVAKSAGEAGDSLSLTVAERLLEKSQPQPAALYLRGWLDRATLDDADTASRFVAAALEAGDPRTALLGARKFGLAKLDAPAAGALARALAKTAMTAEADEVRAAANMPPASVPDLVGPANPAGPALPDASAGAHALRDRGNRDARGRVAALGPDMLTPWRRALSIRMAEEAQKLAAQLGHPMPRVGNVSAGRIHATPRAPSQSTTKILKKTDRVLQQTKHLKALKIKQKLVRERAQSASRKKQGLPAASPARDTTKR